MVRGGGGWGYPLLAGSTYWLLPVISPFLDNISLVLSQFRTETSAWAALHTTCWVSALFLGPNMDPGGPET